MTADFIRTRALLAASDFTTLFIEELGWNHHHATMELSVDGLTFTLSAIAEKCGMAAFLCLPAADERIPEYAVRRKIERQVTKGAHEHLIIFIDGKRITQVWQWVRRERGKPSACREHIYHVGQPGDSLIQKLHAIAVSLEEEERLTLMDVTGRARKAFDVERVTKRFYDRFKAEHATFLKFLEGIPDEEMERWYVSVMLNRLMFIYFIQKKGFLDSDPNYLKNKLGKSKAELGKDRYYRDVLCPLFFEGFAKRKEERSDKANRLLGEVPYLNGGIFMPHQIEQLHGKAIAIPDQAFDKLFEFFEAYQWHLDDRPTSQDNEIRPDVLGYIFEKYINQKQMGAYYTKEDITEYISKNTVIPFVLDQAKEKCRIAFEPALHGADIREADQGDRSVWRLLREDPDRYIYEPVRRGIVKSDGTIIPESTLPDFVQKGMHDPKARMVEKRYNLGQAVLADQGGTNLALPTETWREYVNRRERCLELRRKLQAGEIREVNDLITYNLDIRQFAQDVIENCEGPELLVAFWKAIESVTILDPTCGSGAFLFAALNILEPLYEACLERMRFFLEEWGEGGKKNHPNYHKLFTETLKRVEDHPNPRYFIFKSIIVNNLYGVDIMEEAVEICKLRLFLKLVAQIERAQDIEPLPDIDFNIRAGNTLVGFVSLDEVKKTQEGTLGFGKEDVARIEEEAEVADRAFRKFREMQTEQGMSPADFAEAKENLRGRLKKLTDELDQFLAGEYGIDTRKKGAFVEWRKSHQPFHWFAEYYGILKPGGFDVVIGNPPYVEYKDVKESYAVRGFETLPCGDLYAFCAERAFHLLRVTGHLGLIVPISIFGTDGFEALQRLAVRVLDPMWVSFFANRPSQLFDGAQKRLTILLGRRFQSEQSTIYTTRYYRWAKEEFAHLFASRIEYAPPHATFSVFPTSLEKNGSALEISAFERIIGFQDKLSGAVAKSGQCRVYYTRKFGYFLAFLDFVPHMTEIKTGNRISPSELKELCMTSAESASAVIAALSSSIFFWFWNVVSDCRNLNRRDLLAFTLDPERLPVMFRLSLAALAQRYLEHLKGTSRMMVKSGLRIETFDYAACKPVLDEIDQVLAKHYGFTDEEFDFIINCDIKYRMGQEGLEDSEE